MNNLFPQRRGVKAVAALAVLLVLGGLAFSATYRNVLAAPATSVAPAIPAEKTAVLSQLEDGFAAIAQRMNPSVVMIRVQKTVRAVDSMPNMPDVFRDFPGLGGGDEGTPGMRPAPRAYSQRGAGSGAIVRSDGWILTNDHVVGGADKVTVVLQDGREMEGTVRRDFRSDLALVKINATNLVPAELGDSDKVRVGQWAVAFGAPFELSDTMTIGIISAMHRQTAISEGREGRFYPSLLQTDAAINPGNSGGPLVDIHGRIIGINVAINSPSGGSVGIGFAIPSNTARNVMNQLMTSGKVTRGYLGVAPAALTPALRQRYGVTTGGALVQQVSDNTPAAKAGIQVEDIVTSIDGKPVLDDVSLREVVSNTAPGKKVDIVLRRAGKTLTVSAVLGTMPDELAAAAPAAQPDTSSKLGVHVDALTADTAKRFNLTSTNGVVVTQVESGSAAEDAGIQTGDVILRVNTSAIRTPADLNAAVSAVKSGDAVTMVIRRQNSRMLVTIDIP